MYYVIDYEAGKKGCPIFFDADLNEEWEWDEFDPEPQKFKLEKNYVLMAKHSCIAFDYANEYLISKEYSEVCRLFAMRFSLVPVKIIQSNGKPTNKAYFFLLTNDYISIIDADKSTFEVEVDVESGEPVFDAYMPDCLHYDKIEKFVVDESKVGDHAIFRCPDIGHRYVCSADFRAECLQRGLSGLAFEAIDDNFRYAAFW